MERKLFRSFLTMFVALLFIFHISSASLASSEGYIGEQIQQQNGIPVTVGDFTIRQFVWLVDKMPYYSMIITNNASLPVSSRVNLRFYDKNGSINDAGRVDIAVIGPGETTACATRSDIIAKV